MNDIKKAAEKTEELSRKIWLAGLGAYGQSFDNLHNGYEKMSDQAREYFEELVSRGEKLENDTRDNIKTTRQKIKSQADKNKELFSKQFTEFKGRVSSGLDKEELLEELQSRVTKLTETINKLLPAKDKKAAKSTATKKAAAKKATAKKTAAGKTTAKAASASKSTATKKPAAKKTTTRKTATAKTAASKTTAPKTTRRKAAAPKADAAPKPAAAAKPAAAPKVEATVAPKPEAQPTASAATSETNAAS